MITAPQTPSREGYIISGWYKDSEYKNIWNFSTDSVTSEIELFAKWSKSFSITYELNGSTNGDNPGYYTADMPAFLLKDAVKEGYLFLGWFETDTDAAVTEIDGSKAKNISLYADFALPVSNLNNLAAMSSEGKYVLTGNLNLGGATINPITEFRGIFDGKGYTISNLTIELDLNKTKISGFFKKTSA